MQMSSITFIGKMRAWRFLDAGRRSGGQKAGASSRTPNASGKSDPGSLSGALGDADVLFYFNSRKNFVVADVSLVTVYCPFTITGEGTTGCQFVEGKFVAYWSVKPMAFVGHKRTRELPCGAAPTFGATVVNDQGSPVVVPA
jgi:hypothetical protein